MKESDWKIFKKIKTKALDTFCKNVLQEFNTIIKDESKTAHENYLTLYEKIHERDDILASIFNGHSRSKADFQLMAMRFRGIADDALVKTLSPEFQKFTQPRKL